MKVIGITGGIGTGKSTVLNILQQYYDAYIVETDKLAHHLMSPGQSAYNEIVEYFGAEIICEDTTIDRSKLGQIVFHNKEKLHRLNEIVHPAVKEYIINDIVKKRQEQKVTYYIIEAALLIEDGYKSICDEMWYIYSSQETRLKRLLADRGGNEEKWIQVMKNQATETFYRDNCDVMIDNSYNVEKTMETIKGLLC